MKIRLNGESTELDESSLTISELLVSQSVKMPDMVTVEHNGTIIDREKFDKQQVKEGDEVEFLYFMGGGQ